MQYDREFHKLSRFAKRLVPTEKDRMKRFVHDLKLTIQKDLALLDLKSHAEALDKALKLEMFQDQMDKEGKQEQKKRSCAQEEVQDKNSCSKKNKHNPDARVKL